MHRARHLPLTSLLALLMGAGALVPGGASAAWPPPPTATAADMANPQHWPNDPAYAYSSESDGQWNYYSFVPDPSGFVTPRPEETAAGMSIDLAWRLTTGDPRVRIAITDSGIHWDEPDLVEQVWLNHRELTSHKPRTANDDPCGGEGELAGFDCNGDGKLTVADYRDTPSLQPPRDLAVVTIYRIVAFPSEFVLLRHAILSMECLPCVKSTQRADDLHRCLRQCVTLAVSGQVGVERQAEVSGPSLPRTDRRRPSRGGSRAARVSALLPAPRWYSQAPKERELGASVLHGELPVWDTRRVRR